MGVARLFDTILHRATMRRWARAVAFAETADLAGLRRQRSRARALHLGLDAFLHVAEGRFAMPHIGSAAFARPGGTDWAWRPDLWRWPEGQRGMTQVRDRTGFACGVTVFHDCPLNELTLRQMRNSRADDLAPFGLRLDVLRFEGRFLSLALDLPKAAAAGLTRRHILRVATTIEMETPVDVNLRLNIRHGPDTAQLTKAICVQDGVVEFDLDTCDLNEKRVEHLWLDLIAGSPDMNQITIRDITLCRYPRAEM